MELELLTFIQKASQILVIVGAGISTSCGIPDFRSSNGLFDFVMKNCPSLCEPEEFFHVEFINNEPELFYSLSKKFLKPNIDMKPSSTHLLIKYIESKKKLLRLYSQNIDGLEEKAGISKVVFCHGKWNSSSCLRCKKKSLRTYWDLVDDFYCHHCREGIMKPDICFYGEKLPKAYFRNLEKDACETDLLLVIGTSLSVKPVSEIISLVPPTSLKILLNKTPLDSKKQLLFDRCFWVDCEAASEEILALIKSSS